MEDVDEEVKMEFDSDKYCKIDITPHQGTSMRISRDKSYIVFGTRAGNVVSYNQLTKRIERVATVSARSIWNLYLSSDSSFILAGGVDSEIKYLTFPEMELLEPLTGHTQEINHIIICNSNTACYSASDDWSVRVWSIPDRIDATIYSHRGKVYALDLSSDEHFLVSGAGDGSLILFDTSRSAISWTSTLTGGIWSAKISNYNNYVIAGDFGGNVTVMTFQGELIRSIRNKHLSRVRCMDFASDEQLFVSAGDDHRIKIWEVDSWREEMIFDYHLNWVKAVVIDMENRTVTSIGDDCAIYIINIPEFNTNFYLPEVFRKGKVLYFSETNCFYAIRSEILYVCTAVGLEIVNEVKIKQMKGVSSFSICKCGGKIGIGLGKLILTIDIFTYEIKFVNISTNVFLSVFDQYGLAIGFKEVSVVSTQSLKILGYHQIGNISFVEALEDRIFLCNKTKIFEVNTEKILFEYHMPGTVLMKVLPGNKILAISSSKTLSIFSLTYKRHLLFTTSLEDMPLQVFSDSQRFFLVYNNIVKVHSCENYLQVSNITTTMKILEITPLDSDTIICCDENYATLVKFCHTPVGSCAILWTNAPINSVKN